MTVDSATRLPLRARGSGLAPVIKLGGLAAGALPLLALGVHLTVNATTDYGVHRDELLYLAMGRHLRLWRMDFPPFIAIAANATRALGGESLVALRLFPAVAHALLVALAALLTREFGGGRAAQVVAALAVVTSPLFLGAGNLLQPVIFDQIWWTLALFALVRLANDREVTSRAPWWLALGASLGLGLLTKFSIAFIALPIAVAILLAPERRWLATRWPWLALLVALAIGSPSLVGQLALAAPARGQLMALRGGLAQQGYARFVVDQLLFGPGLLAAALVGLGALLAARRLAPFRAVGVACAGAFLILFALRGKMYYIGPVYPTLVAAGAATLDRLARPAARRLALAAVALGAVAYGVVVAPLVLPMLPAATTARYALRLGLSRVTIAKEAGEPALTQDFADMLGWPELTRLVTSVYTTLPSAERGEAVLVGNNYGEAGALEFHGAALGLPRVVSTAGSMWFFGPGERPGTLLIAVGVSRGDPLLSGYADVREVARFYHPWMIPEERNLPILVARRPTRTLQALWPSLGGRN